MRRKIIKFEASKHFVFMVLKNILPLIFIFFIAEAFGQSGTERANGQSNSKNAFCAVCSVDSTLKSIDADDETFSILNITSAVNGAFLEQTLIYPSGACAGDTVWIVIENENKASDTSLVGVTFTSFNGLISNNDESPAPITYLLPNGRTRVPFIPQKIYDRVSVKLNVGLAGAVTGLRIYFSLKLTKRPVITGIKTICQGKSTSLTAAIADHPTAIFSWYALPSGGAALFSGTASQPFNTPALSSSQTYYVERCSPNNSLRTSVNVTVIPSPVKPTLSGDTSLCRGQNSVLTASGPSDYHYRWFKNASGGSSFFEGSVFITPALLADTDFFVESFILPDSCISSVRSKIHINVLATDNVPSGAHNDTICPGYAATLVAVNPHGADFKWYASNSGGIPLSTDSIFVTPLLYTTTSYWLESFLPTCGSSPSRTEVKAVIKKIPEIPIAADTAKVCAGDNIVLTAFSNTNGALISWWDADTLGHKFFDGQNFGVGNFNRDTLFWVQSALDGCIASKRKKVYVKVKPLPQPPTVSGITTICKGTATLLQASAAESGATLSWEDANHNLITTGEQLNTGVLNDTTIYYTRSTFNGCTGDATQVIVNVGNILSPPVIHCGTATAVSVTFVWDEVPGATGYQVSVNGNPYESPNGSNSHTIYNLNPEDTVGINVISLGAPPCNASLPSNLFVCRSLSCGGAYFTPLGDQKICKGDVLALKIPMLNTNKYRIRWNNSSKDTTTEFQYIPLKNDTVTLEVSDLNQPSGCPPQKEFIKVNVFEKPKLSLRANPQSLIIPGDVQFFDETPSDSNYYWDFGDGTISNERNPLHHYDSVGIYDVKLIVINAFGCADSILAKDLIDAHDPPVLDVANSFTPNGDGKNDIFIPNVKRVVQFNMKIFNPSGKLLFESNDINSGWDGRDVGVLQPVGAYFYTIRAVTDDNREVSQKGIVNIVR